MRMMFVSNTLRRWQACGLVMLILFCWASAGFAQTISGSVINRSVWDDLFLAPPGDGDGYGEIRVGYEQADGSIMAITLTNGVMPLLKGPYPYTLGSGLPDGTYKLYAWVDADASGGLDVGEPYGTASATITASNSVGNVTVRIVDDTDLDTLPDWWEAHWFRDLINPLSEGASSDPDADGLTNYEEYRFSVDGYGFDYLNPANWDTDGDRMDDGWECRYFNPELIEGLNPVLADDTDDFDGDGLSNWQEYCGVDGYARMVFDQMVDSVVKGKMNPLAAESDDLNPLDVDTDFDLLVDSFEMAWYDPVNKIDPRSGGASASDSSIAREDSDQDGLSNFREQCLLGQLHQATTNGWVWNWSGTLPFGYYTHLFKGTSYRMSTMTPGGQKLSLGLIAGENGYLATNRFLLRNHEWTDPTDGTGYKNDANPGTGYLDDYFGVAISGHDSDSDGLPDGWEVQFNLNPRDPGLTGPNWDNGPFGDPDNDGLMNYDEFVGQDGNRFTSRPYINGTGDETNPNEYNWRPDSTYEWRWIDRTVTVSTEASEREMGSPRPGTGINRKETLGSALPTAGLGVDGGADSDDDGLSDADEIAPATPILSSSPVDSCDPFIPRSALVTSTNGIVIPDPEPDTIPATTSAGWRPDLQRRNWTLECQVKLLGTNLTGNLFNFQSIRGPQLCTVYRLSLSNNAPVLASDNTLFAPVQVSANALPTNRWIHLAAVWNCKNNSLGLYIDGVLSMASAKLTESLSVFMQAASNQLTLAESPDGSFVNRLLIDEVRIWGVARTEGQIAEYRRKLVPGVNGDDVWINQENAEYYSHTDVALVNGGSLFDGEPGVPLANVYAVQGSYWIDDGDGLYKAAKDTLLTKGTNLMEGLAGVAVKDVLWHDKDHSGDYSRNSLLAYYRFDDGGSSAEDFARRAKSGLLGAVAEEFRFGDRGYALSTNSFQFAVNSPASVYGVDKRGADDSDFDGLPDAWELIHHMNLWEDGTRDETSVGAKNGPDGAQGDPDGDGLVNIYEFWAGTNPRYADSDGEGILDSQEDRDGDGVVNITEQLLGSRPDMIDTDDDGLADNEEQGMGTSPVNPLDPAISRAVVLGGSPQDYLEIPVNLSQRMRDWTLESWVMPSNAVAGAGVIIRRVVERMAGETQAGNYVMGLETNGVGGLRPYAGYIWPDGKQYIIRAGTVPSAAWTHLAASYSRLNATLTLYVNGAVAASTNTFYIEPPVSGRGGETFVRIGEDFAGALDEVRLWSKVRSISQIVANTNRVISASDTNGLIHYFRFDDGEANTNMFSWSEFHQAAGLQDFCFEADWNEEWRHASIKNGDIGTIIPGAIVPPPSLRVMLQPDEALAAGAQWSIDGGVWQDSGTSQQDLNPGAHTVMFREIPGWTQPMNETIALSNGVATTITRVYIRKSGVAIWFNNSPLPELAGWAVNGGAWMTNGMVLTNLNAGVNTVSYRPVPGFFAPVTEQVNLVPGETLQLWREYSIMTANISAAILPSGVTVDGAMWRVDGGAWQVGGAVVGGLSLSAHQVEFSDVARWITPSTIEVVPTNQVLVVVTGQYSQVTGLAVDILPATAVASGAQWRVSGGNWTNSGTLIPLAVGSYIVEFKPLDGVWLAPGNQTAAIVDQQVTELIGTYYRADVFGGTVSTNPGDFWLPQALDSDALHRLFVADTSNDRIQMYDSLTQQWTVWGKFGTALGQFKKPSGVAVDRLGNLFVADQSNNRIQKRVATNGQWVAIGSNTLVAGTALGQFNAPSDVAVASDLTLYVADMWNNRVQKLTTSGVWSVFITNGSAVGRVQYPKGLHVDSSDNLYVSDDGVQTNGLNRIQKFSKTGQYLELLGGRDPSLGDLQNPGGMSIGNGNLYVANSHNNRVAFSDMSGTTWKTLVGSNVLSNPGDVEWDPRGYLYVADTSHHRILMVLVDPAAATNGITYLSAMSSPGTNTSFTLSWFGRLNWNYAVQYANSLGDPTLWNNLPGYSAVSGHDMMTNCTDTTVMGVTNRFYRIIAY